MHNVNPFSESPLTTKISDGAHLAPLPLFRNTLRPHSSILVDGPERAAARAMLYLVGLAEEDFKKPIIGVGSLFA